MSARVVAFFSDNDGAGKTTLVYHLAWMFSDRGAKVLAVDLDPQSELSAAFLGADALEALWLDDAPGTVFRGVQSLLRGESETPMIAIQTVSDNLALIASEFSLGLLEDELSLRWHRALSGDATALPVLSAFRRVIRRAALGLDAQLILLDLGSNLGAVNRAALLSADHIVVALAPELFSMHSLRNLGPAFARWRSGSSGLDLPNGKLDTLGYVVLHDNTRLDRPTGRYHHWMSRIPSEFRKSVLNEPPTELHPPDDPYNLAVMKNYRSLMPMAAEARKPAFHLKPADGALGSHLQAALEVRKEYEALAKALERGLAAR